MLTLRNLFSQMYTSQYVAELIEGECVQGNCKSSVDEQQTKTFSKNGRNVWYKSNIC